MPQIGNQENWGHITVKTVKKDLGVRHEVQEMLPYGDIVTGYWKGTIQTPEALAGPFAGRTIAAGKQLKILFIRIWTFDPNGIIWEVRQAGGSRADIPNGIRDYPALEAAGAEVIGPQSLDDPYGVFEGTVGFYIQDSKASRYKHAIAWYGIERKGDQED